jgi:hypothetical protein
MNDSFFGNTPESTDFDLFELCACGASTFSRVKSTPEKFSWKLVEDSD